jgi:lipopolysaccharide transport protein LptA
VVFGCGLVLASPQDERLRLLSADLLENVPTQGQTVQMLTGHVKFRKGDMELTTDRATFYRSQELSHLSGDVVMVRPGEHLTCDSLIFYSSEDRLHAWGDVTFIQEDQTITCRELVYWTEIDSGVARRDVVMVQGTRQLTADEFRYQKREGARGASFHAFGAVVVDEGERRVSGQRMTYDDLVEVLELSGDAAVKEEDRDLRGTRIRLQYDDEVLEAGSVEEGAEATALIQAQLSADSHSWRTFTDVLTSREMEADFVDDRLAALRLEGMATSIYSWFGFG